MFGAADNGFEADNATATLTELGADVDRESTLPADLSPFQTIWYVSAYDSLSADDVSRLSAFVAAGGSAYLTGERPCCEPLNSSVQALLRAVLTDRDVTVGARGDINGPFTFNPAVVDQLASQPNVLTDFVPESPGGLDGIGNVSAPNVFASNGSVAVGAAWSDKDMLSGRGRLALLMDVDWLGSSDRTPIIENIQRFLSRGAVCGDSGTDLVWSQSPANCSTLVAPFTGRTWQVTTGDASTPTVTVAATGLAPSCMQRAMATNSVLVTCAVVAGGSGRLTVTAQDASGHVSVRSHAVQPKNDRRNVPVPFALDSNWWSWPDADGDGLPNNWETSGVWVGNRLLDLPALGADPQHKDLFLHADFEQGRELDDEVFTNMRNSFAASPLTNPDGRTGIALHVERGASVPSPVVGDFSLTTAAIQRVTTWSGFANSPQAGGDGVPRIFKWMLNLAPSASAGNVIGQAKLGGYYGFTAWDLSGIYARLNVDLFNADKSVHWAEASNMMHELGHELGLDHHGAVGTPTNDSSYKSIMSYSYSNFGVVDQPFDRNRRIDYSRETKVNNDWIQGAGVGKLTLVRGQYGELPDFYPDSFNQAVPGGDAPVTAEPTQEQTLAEIDPSDFGAFAAEFGLTAAPDFPVVTGGPIALSVQSGQPASATLQAHDQAGSAMSLIVDQAPLHGTVTTNGLTVTYAAVAGYTGPDNFTVRARGAALSSEPVTLTATVTAPTPVVSTVRSDSGAGQSRTTGQAFDPLTATVLDPAGHGVVGVGVDFVVRSGAGNFPGGATQVHAISDSRGVVTSPTLTAGGTPGPVLVEAQVAGLTPATYALMITAPASGPTQADLRSTISGSGSVGKGKTVTLTITVRNSGPSTSPGTTLSFAVVGGTVVDAAGVRRVGALYLLDVGKLASDGTKTWTLSVRAGTSVKQVLGAVTAFGTARDPHPLNNIALWTARVR